MYRNGSHTVSRMTAHIVWVTKYRYHVLTGDVQKRCRDIVIQICDSEDVKILKGVVSKDHVHMHIEYPPKHTRVRISFLKQTYALLVHSNLVHFLCNIMSLPL